MVDSSPFRPDEIILGKYRYVKTLGTGGMGEVALVENIQTHQKLAMKCCLVEKYHERFSREVLAWLALGNHPNLVAAYYFAKTKQLPVLFIEYIEGETLWQTTRHLDNSLTSLEKVLDYAIQISRGMAHLHHCGIIHRDLTPYNILVAKQAQSIGLIKITDMGLSKFKPHPQQVSSHLATSEITGVNDVLGTLQYMSPQQYICSQEAEESSDIYSFGMILYEMLSLGKRPFEVESSTGWLYAHTFDRPIPIKKRSAFRPSLWRRKNYHQLHQLVMACLAKKSTARPSSFWEIERQLVTLYQEILQKPYRRSKVALEKDYTPEAQSNNRAVSLIELDKQNVEQAYQILQTLRKDQPQLIEAHLNFLLLCLRLNKYSLTRFWQATEKLLTTSPEGEKVLATLLQGILEQRSLLEKGKQLLSEVSNIKAYPELSRYQAKLLYLEGNHHQAEEVFANLATSQLARAEDFYHLAGCYLYQSIQHGASTVNFTTPAMMRLQLASDLKEQLQNLLEKAQSRYGKDKLLQKITQLLQNPTLARQDFWYQHRLLPPSFLSTTSMTPDGDKLLLPTSNHHLQLWTWENQDPLGKITSKTPITSFHLTPEADYIIVGELSGHIALWQQPKNNLITRFCAHQGPVTHLFSNSIGQFVSIGEDGWVKIWHLETLPSKWHPLLLTRKRRLTKIFAPQALTGTLDGKYLVIGERTGKISVWHKQPHGSYTLEQKMDLKQPINSLYLSANGTTLAGIRRNAVKNVFFKKLNQTKLKFLCLPQANQIVLSGNARQFIIGTQQGIIQIGFTNNQQILTQLTSHSSPISSLHISADGRTLLSTDQQQRTICWRNEPIWPLYMEEKYWKV